MRSICLAWHPLLIDLCLRSCIGSPGPHGFCTFTFLTLTTSTSASSGFAWALCGLMACVSIFRFNAAIASQHFQNFCCKCISCILCALKIGKGGEECEGKCEIIHNKKNMYCMKLHVHFTSKKKETLSIKTEQNILNKYKWGNGTIAVPWSAQ